jgi:2,3-diketo-5-methylthio-1-phosphopentane phosphatase
MTNAPKQTVKVFIDFDGTITTEDVGEKFFVTFADKEKAYAIVNEWLDGKITSRQTWERLCALIENLDMKKFDEFINGISLDPYFIEFVEFLEARGIEPIVLSDGLDYYIERILKKYGLERLKVYSNKAIFENGRCRPEFPYTDEECDLCANCKRNHIIANSADDDITFYIGDGFSDACPVQYCDFVFAKRTLLKYCEKHRITFFPYSDFGDVRKRMEELFSRRRLKKRHRAFLKRREVYLKG